MAVRINADADKAFRTANLPASNSITVFERVKLLTDTNDFATFFALYLADQSNYQVLETDSDGVTLNVFDGAGNGVAGAALIVGDWYAIGYSSDGTTLRLYMKNLSKGTASQLFTAAARPSAPAFDTMAIGGSAFSEVPNADFEAPRIFRTAFTTQAQFDLEADSLVPVSGFTQDSWFTFANNGSPALTDDQSANGRDLSLGAGTWETDAGLDSGRNGIDQERLDLLLLENGTDAITREAPANTGAVDLESADELLLESGSLVLKESGAGTAAYSLACDPGAVAITGTAASLERGLEVAAAAGAVAITGTAASLKVGRRVQAAAGAVAITGTAAGLRATRDFDAASGAVPITGTAATLRKGVTMQAAAGAVPITGTAATLRPAREVDATTGAVPITGTAASLERSLRVDAQAGALPITGTSANLERGLEVAAASGAVPISGSAAGLLATRKLQAGAGAIGIAGTAANLEHSRVLSAGAGAVAITGTAADLVFGNDVELEADPGSVPITGTAAVLRAAYRVAAAAGAVPISGVDAGLAVVSEPTVDVGGRQASIVSSATSLSGSVTAVLDLLPTKALNIGTGKTSAENS